MSIIRAILSIGAGILATAASYVLMSSKNEFNNKKESSGPRVQPDPQCMSGSGNPGDPEPSGMPLQGMEPSKSDKLLKTLDKVQVGLMNFARFASEVIRSVILFVRAMRCYEYNNSYHQYQR